MNKFLREKAEGLDEYLQGHCTNSTEKTIFSMLVTSHVTVKKMVSPLVQQNLLSTDLQTAK